MVTRSFVTNGIAYIHKYNIKYFFYTYILMYAWMHAQYKQYNDIKSMACE